MPILLKLSVRISSLFLPVLLIYCHLRVGGKLNSHLVEVDQQTEVMLSRLVEQMVQRQGVTEQLKTSNQMVWSVG